MSLVFPHTEHLTPKKDDALKLLPKNGFLPRLTLGSCKAIVWEMNCHGPKLLLCTAVLLVLQNSWVHIPSSALGWPWQRCSPSRYAAVMNMALKWINLGYIILTISRTHYSSVGAGSYGFLSVHNNLHCACKRICKFIITQSII